MEAQHAELVEVVAVGQTKASDPRHKPRSAEQVHQLLVGGGRTPREILVAPQQRAGGGPTGEKDQCLFLSADRERSNPSERKQNPDNHSVRLCLYLNSVSLYPPAIIAASSSSSLSIKDEQELRIRCMYVRVVCVRIR